jgi:hypothetical protein
MKRLAAGALLLGVCLAGCSTGSSVGGWADRTFLGGFIEEGQARKTNEALYRADLRACGRGPGSEWCRLAADDGNLARLYPAQNARASRGQPSAAFVFDDSQCIGVMVGDRCRGRIGVPPATAPTCHGQMIDGECTGPIY